MVRGEPGEKRILLREWKFFLFFEKCRSFLSGRETGPGNVLGSLPTSGMFIQMFEKTLRTLSFNTVPIIDCYCVPDTKHLTGILPSVILCLPWWLR